MPKWDEPAFRKHRRKTSLDEWSELHGILGKVVEGYVVRAVCKTVWRLIGVQNDWLASLWVAFRASLGVPPASVLTGSLQLSEPLKQRSSGLPDEWEAPVNLQGRRRGQYFKRIMSGVEHICAEVPVLRWRWAPSRLFEAVGLKYFLPMSASSRLTLLLSMCSHPSPFALFVQPAQRVRSTWTTTSLWCVSGSWWAWRTLPPCSA